MYYYPNLSSSKEIYSRHDVCAIKLSQLYVSPLVQLQQKSILTVLNDEDISNNLRAARSQNDQLQNGREIVCFLEMQSNLILSINPPFDLYRN